MSTIASPLEEISTVMRRKGAERVIFKLLANNDNSKQQIYLGCDFDVLRLIKHGDLVAGDNQNSTKGPMFKASLNFHWINLQGVTEKANGAQLILYPKYPEVRMSGFARGCSLAPSHLLQPPTKEQRFLRADTPRCLILGLCQDGRILAYLDHWEGPISREVKCIIASGKAINSATIFYEKEIPQNDSKAIIIDRLREIYRMGAIRSCRLDPTGNRIEYVAKNGAGYTLESLFEITPNGRSEPDHLGWELKSHSTGPVTLMTPEPDMGSYLVDLSTFLEQHGRCAELRRDFTARHKPRTRNTNTGLTLRMEGYDQEKGQITNVDGGLILRNDNGEIAAGWSFDKLLTHWSRKHAKTAYVTYFREDRDIPYYTFGPKVHMCEGAELTRFLRALNNNIIYHDPGIKMELSKKGWRAKKRNQFRVAWKNVSNIYEHMSEENLN